MKRTRRQFLAGTAAVSAAFLGGCASAEEEIRRRFAEAVGRTDGSPPLGSSDADVQAEDISSDGYDFLGAVPAETMLQTDVCVVGGGAAGMAAATSAARAGADTVLLEEAYVLGGNVTRGLVNLDRVVWGGSEPMVEGYFAELVRDLEEMGAAVYPCAATEFTVPYQADVLAALALEKARAAGVRIHLGARAVGVSRREEHIHRLWVQEQGYLAGVEAEVYIDCTGDGNLGYLAGVGHEVGHTRFRQIQGQSLMFEAGPVDFDRLRAYAESQGYQNNPYQVIGFYSFMKGAKKAGRVPDEAQKGFLINRNLNPKTVSVSASEAYGNHLEKGTFARTVLELQDQNRVIMNALAEDIPGFEEARIVRTAARPYLREGRRIEGHYRLTVQDVLGVRKPEGSIARGWYPLDLHVRYEGGAVVLGTVPSGDWYGVPYGCLVARDADNLLMAGRCISVTHEALGSTRISPLSMALGEAAGLAAAHASGVGVSPARLSVRSLQRNLRRAGALI